jgi:hypothetical protein
LRRTPWTGSSIFSGLKEWVGGTAFKKGPFESRDRRDMPREMWVASSNNFGGGENGIADRDERGCDCSFAQP